MWYVMQVTSGKEEYIKDLRQKLVNVSAYRKIFIPRYICSRKYEGSWHDDALIMFPGYVFVDTDSIDEFRVQLYAVPGMTAVIGDGENAIPVHEKEREHLLRMMNDDDVILISKGIIIGDRIEILSGPLKDYSATITKIDRHKRTAEIEVKLFGTPIKATVGLEVIKKIEN